RVDDDRVGSKRVEFFAIPRADNQRTVRIRFAHAGTDSWYFGIDDFGLYSVTAGGSGVAPTLTVVREGTGLKIGWAADASGFRLESSPTAQPGSWTAVTGVSGNTHTVTPSGSAGFYRLTK
ncbi:MAG: hypothetical protein IT580_06595, partial [Verrucomicrobiales bacterium]|nr:hypothetical protein [Verrucomicrobiales bacterium]